MINIRLCWRTMITYFEAKLIDLGMCFWHLRLECWKQLEERRHIEIKSLPWIRGRAPILNFNMDKSVTMTCRKPQRIDGITCRCRQTKHLFYYRKWHKRVNRGTGCSECRCNRNGVLTFSEHLGSLDHP